MNCFFCKNEDMKPTTSSELIEFDTSLIIIRNVPCLECEQCGEKIYTDETMKRLEKLVSSVKQLLPEVSIIDFAKSA